MQGVNVIGGPLRSLISYKIDLICYRINHSNDYTQVN